MAVPPEGGFAEFNVETGVVASTARRTMKFYRVHEPELQNLSMAHGLMVLFFSAGSAFLGFGLDVAKDIAMATDLTAEAKVMKDVVQPACFWIASGFYLAGLWAAWKRRGSIQRIKHESGEAEYFVDRCIKRWHQIRFNPLSNAASARQQPQGTGEERPR